MSLSFSKSAFRLNVLIVSIAILASCNKSVIPGDLPGSYAGKQRVLVRYDNGGQYIYRDEFVMVSLIIDNKGNMIGMVGNAAFESTKVTQNRGWVGRQLGIKTDYLISGILKGNIFDKDTMVNKDISMPFNIENNELKGSLLLKTNGDSFPIISLLNLKRANE